MTDYIRRLVSGNKARFKDRDLNLELDLIYLTDHIIIMGFPAAGLEGLYRNRREDVKKFLDHRHGKNYWIFNFCPILENSYDAEFFEGRVSRYPYPDHHAPPLAIMPLLTREMHVWLDGASNRVAVLHCKAGKGRSGTMACAYLLTLGTAPVPPQLKRSYSKKEWAKKRAQDAMQAVPGDIDEAGVRYLDRHGQPSVLQTKSSELADESVGVESMASATQRTSPSPSYAESLKNVLDLLTSRRMRAPSPGKKIKDGISIPSQRRWLYYWALLLADEAPVNFWADPTAKEQTLGVTRVWLSEIKLRMKESSATTMNLMWAANYVIEKTGKGTRTFTPPNGNPIWASLARYDDELVERLETWERHTRDPKNMGRRKPGSERMGNEVLADFFKDGRWDKSKMVRSFARMAPSGEKDVIESEDEIHGKIMSYMIRPLSDESWADIREELEQEETQEETSANKTESTSESLPPSETASVGDFTQEAAKERGIVLDAAREARVKLYMGQLFIGWVWFIPAFHMVRGQTSSKLLLTCKDIDFPMGIGSSIVDLEISLESLKGDEEEVFQPASRAVAEGDGPSGTMLATNLATGTERMEEMQTTED